jgi:hypothetical protein
MTLSFPNRPILFSLLVLSVAFTECHIHPTSVNYVALENFHFSQVALDPGTPLRLLAFSGGAPSDSENVYYYSFLCLNMATHDTVRILSPLITFDDSENKSTYTTPLQIDAGTQIRTVTFQPIDSTVNLMLQIEQIPPQDGSVAPGLIDSLQSHIHQKQFVVVNNSMEVFRTNRYPTAFGILHFPGRPW